jgi:23S rRNA (guanosine2251-2'-O)-methyltransferase
MKHSEHPRPSAVNPAGSPDENIIIPGRKGVIDTLASNPEQVEFVYLQKGAKTSATDRIMDDCRRLGVRYRLVRREELDRMYQGNHQGVLAVLFEPGFMELDELLAAARKAPLPVIVAFDHVQDPGNVGTLARTTYALGAAGLVMGRHGSARLGAGAMRASAGALARLGVHKSGNLQNVLQNVRDEGFFVYGAQMEKKTSMSIYELDYAMPCALVLGSEEKGLSKPVAKLCDALVHIPMARAFDSINVAQAGAIVLAEMARRHGRT